MSSNVLLTLRQNDNSQVLQVVSVPILNDDVFEDSEDFSAMLQPTGSLPQLISLGQTRTSIRIFDDDSMFFTSTQIFPEIAIGPDSS